MLLWLTGEVRPGGGMTLGRTGPGLADPLIRGDRPSGRIASSHRTKFPMLPTIIAEPGPAREPGSAMLTIEVNGLFTSLPR